MLAGEKIIAEKITQLSDNASSIPRLGIPPYEWWSESLHGIAANGPGVSFSNGPVQSATMFSQVLLTAASFNGTLWYSIARATAVEARAMYNVGQAGLTFWAPNGLQGEDLSASSSGGLMLSACCKHFIGYDLENWTGIERYSFNAVITEQDAQDTYVPPFQSCIQDAKASCLMCSYNEVAGIPACAMGSVFKKIRKFYNCYIIILSGNKVEKLCDLCNITVNKNAVFGDSSALAPGGVRIGAPAMTSRSLVEKDFEQIAELLHQAVNFCLKKLFI
ncbi:hypothetical protein Syun_010463 [Stephania yunnanensis]|uniref:Serine hydroxymethyltransferase-like domain-containing protein n=1 Tax=Stephania yunnanensis TaxID=152371 RepID=A0AAP0PRP1_9MAGN